MNNSHTDDAVTAAQRILDGKEQPGDAVFCAAWIREFLAQRRRDGASAPDQRDLFFTLGGER